MKGPLEADTCRDYVLPALRAAGWSQRQIVEQHHFTDGRIVPVGRRHRRKEGKRADYLLEIEPGLTVAIVEAKRLYRLPADGLQQAMRYAEILKIPFAYASNGSGIVEQDYDTGRQSPRNRFPSPDELWRRFRAWRGIADDQVAADLLLPFNRALRNPDGSVKETRYYQRIAIGRVVEAVLKGEKRVLLTMATGTGKTFTALQIVWKLWSGNWIAGRRPRVLYLADRNILIDQPIEREFRPVYGDAVWAIRGGAKTGRDIYFALYQALAASGDSLGLFRDYPRDYFDFIIVDECHRGSADEESSWRDILDHFAPATQLGMTATPRRTETADSYEYFGSPVYEYSLAQGIDDGFLAPYRVRRVVLSPDAHGWSPSVEQLDRFGRAIPAGLYTTRDFERVVSLLNRTEAAAQHLTEHLKRTNRWAKTIVFCVDSEHAEQMRLALHNANLDLARQYPHYVARIVSAEGEVGAEHLDDFIDPERETPVIATTSRLLSTGVDIPTCKNIVLFRPIGSMVEFKQIIGRGTRLYPDADKLFFDIIDYSGATALFEDPAFDGPPERVVRQEIGETGEVRQEQEVASNEPAYEESPTDEPDAEALEARGARKYYVDGGSVLVTAEAIYLLDPESGRPRMVSYTDFVAGQVRHLFPHAQDLRSRWRTREGRDEVRAALEACGISLVELAERTGLRDADAFDLLVHVAWNAPASSRRERVRRVRTDETRFLNDFAGEARAVIEELLEKYAEHGVDQLDDLHILEVLPLSRHGSPVEIAARFGGPEQLRTAIADLQTRLYAA